MRNASLAKKDYTLAQVCLPFHNKAVRQTSERVVHLNFFRLDPADLAHLSALKTVGISLSSILLLFAFTGFASSPCLGMPFQQQTAEAISRPSIDPPASSQVLKPVEESASSLKASAQDSTPVSPIIVIGFLGGNVKKSNAIHREVQLATQLRQKYPAGVAVEVFANSHGQKALHEIMNLLDADRDGAVSPEEKQRARIILYGHSWGASETVTMARLLQNDKIPVLLTILVDRVSKLGSGDPRIPANVAQAVNFYQLDGFLHGRPTIRAVDPSRTQIIGNYRFGYKDKPVSCDQYPWYARLFMGPHIEIENDPRVWNQVESLISAKLPPQKTTSAALIGQSQ